MRKLKKGLSCLTAGLLTLTNVVSGVPAFAFSYTSNPDDVEIIDSSEEDTIAESVSEENSDVEIIESSEEKEGHSSTEDDETEVVDESEDADRQTETESSGTKKKSSKTTEKNRNDTEEEETESVETDLVVYKAEDAADMAAAVASLDDDPNQRMIVESYDDLTDVLGYGSAVYYDGTYYFSFDSEDERSVAAKALADELGEDAVSEDVVMSVCGSVDAHKDDQITSNISDSTKSNAEAGLRVQNKIHSGDTLIALIDTGCNASYIRGSVNFTSDSDSDENGHGTRMAKYIYEASNGDSMQILSLKAFNDDGTASLSNVVAAINYAIEAGANVINISASIKDSDNTATLKDAINNAISAGITVVASAGNNGRDASDYVPANVDGVITVGAAFAGHILSTSNTGDCVDYYVAANSTSEAAAKMSGFIAANDLDNDDIYSSDEILEGTVDPQEEGSDEKLVTNDTGEAMLASGSTVNAAIVALAGDAANIKHIVVTNNIADTSTNIGMPHTTTSVYYTTESRSQCTAMRECSEHDGDDPASGTHGASGNKCCYEWEKVSYQVEHTTTVTNYIHDNVLSDPIYTWFDSTTGTIYIGIPEGTHLYMAKDASGIFANLANLEELDLSVYDATYTTNTANFAVNDTKVSFISFPATWTFRSAKNSGLSSISSTWHKEDDSTESDLIWHIGADGSGDIEGQNGHIAGDGCQTTVLGTIDDGVGENFTCDTDSTVGFETMYNSSPSTYAGTWIPGLATSHRYWKTEGVANLNNMIEIHHPEAPFTTYCWAQHRGPNSGWYDRVEVKSEAQMIANLQVYNQNYRSLPTSQLLLDGETTVSDPMRRSFITIMYYGDVENDPLNLKGRYGLSDQELAYTTMGAVQWCSDSAESYTYTDAMYRAKREILSQSYKNIPDAANIKFYIYLSAHEGGGQQQMGIESIQTQYYGGLIIHKVNDAGDTMSGCEFTVYSDAACTQAIRTYTSDANGEAGSCRMDSQYGLPVGVYYIKETNTLPGYEVNNDVFRVTVYKDRVTETGYRNSNTSKESLTFVNNSEIVLSTGSLRLRKVSNGNSSKGLVGAKYGIYAASDIIATRKTGTQVTLFSANDLVQTVTTNAEGYASVKLEQGNYYVKEISAPGGYSFNASASGAVSVTKGNVADLVVGNNPKSGTFTVTAQKIIPKGYKIKTGMFTFNLYKQETTLENGKPKLTYVASATNDADGKVTFPTLTYNADDQTDYAGEVQYAIKEVSPTSDSYPRYLYDSHTEYVSGAVIDDGTDTLKIRLTYTSDQSSEDEVYRTTGQFTNTYITTPEIPNPTKTVSKGKVTLVEGQHNVIDYTDSYQYDVYQALPAETSVDYFKSFEIYDIFPAGIKVDSWKVYANGSDVTEKFKFTKTTQNESDDDTRTDTVIAEYIGDFNDPNMYGITYDFQFQVTETKEVAQKESFYNYAATLIEYQDVENHYILDANGNVQKDENGNPLYETTNDYVKNGNGVVDPSFQTKTTTDESKAVHYRTTNEVQTDVYPRFVSKSWDVVKHVYNEDSEEINTWAVHNGDIITYKITTTNKSKRMDGKYTVTDPLPSNTTFVDADNGGTYDASTGNITWTDLELKAGKSYTISFRVKVADSGAFTFDNRATATATCDNARATDTSNPDNVTPATNSRQGDTKQTLNMHNYVPEIRKIVTDEDSYNINEVLVSENSILTYHLYVYNSDTSGDDPSRTGKHTITVTDKIPANTKLISMSRGGQTVSSMPGVGDVKVGDNQAVESASPSATSVKWTEEFNPGEIKVYTFKVQVIGKGVSVVNQAAMATHNTPYDDPSLDKESDTTYPLVPGKTGDADDPEYPSNTVVNGVPSDPLKEVQTLAGVDINEQLLQVGDTYQYVITLDNPTACYKTYTLTDVVPDHVELVKAYESVTTKTDDSVKDVANIKENPTNTVSVDGKNITWVADIQAGETRQFVFTFKTLDKDAHWTNQAHVVISHNVPIDPTTETPIQGGKDYPIERDTNEVENWTPIEPVKTVSATPNEADDEMDMDQMLVFGENADTLTYKITFRNNTTKTKTYTITDTVDEDVDFVEASDNGVYNEETRVITWVLDVEAGHTKYVTFDATVNVGDRVASANNFAKMSVDQAYPNSNTTDTDITTTPTKTVTDKDGNNIDDYLVNKGDTLTYTIRVHNSDELEKHFIVYDEVPENSEFVSATPGVKTSIDRFGEEVISDQTAETSTVEVAQSKTKIAWEADIPSGETWAFRFTVKTTKKDSYIPNQATVTVDRSSIKTNIVENWVPGDPMKVVTEDGTDVNKKTFFKEDRSKITYEISVKNPSTMKKTFTVTDELDENVDFLSADNNGSFDEETRIVTWRIPVAAGETTTVKVEVQFVANPTADKIINVADVTAENWHTTTNTVENYITYAPVKQTLSSSGDALDNKMVFADNEFKYTITWKNPTDEARTYTVTDNLPEHITFVSADNNGKANGQLVTWSDISVAAGEEKTVTVIVKASSELNNKAANNVATVVDSKNPDKYKHETNGSGDGGNATVYVTSISKNVTDADDNKIYACLVSPGDTLKYHIWVDNPSKIDQKVSITDTVPTGLEIVTTDGVVNNQVVTWTDATVPAGGKDFTITCKVKVDATAESFKNVVTGTTGGTSEESNPVVNYLLETPTKGVVTTEDKQDADGKTVDANTSVTYTVTFKNTSTKAQDFTVTDKVDERLLVQKINDGGKMGNGNTITWTATLQAGEEKTVTFEANAPKVTAQTTIENTATVTVNETSQDTNKVTILINPYVEDDSALDKASDKVKNAVEKVNVRATGDASNMTAWIAIGGVTLAAGAAVIVFKKRKH